MTSSTPDGLDLAALDRHLCAGGIARSGAPRAELIVGGRSNLTFLVSEDTSKWVLGWPPLHGLTPSAHEMVRDYRVVAALYDSSVSGCPQGHHARRRLRAGMRRARWSSTFLGGWSAARGSCRRSATRKSSTAASM